MNPLTTKFIRFIAELELLPERFRVLFGTILETNISDIHEYIEYGSDPSHMYTILLAFINRLKRHVTNLLSDDKVVDYREIEIGVLLIVRWEGDLYVHSEDMDIIRVLMVVPVRNAIDTDWYYPNISIKILRQLQELNLIVYDRTACDNEYNDDHVRMVNPRSIIRYQLNKSILSHTVKRKSFAIFQFLYVIEEHSDLLKGLNMKRIILLCKDNVSALHAITDLMINSSNIPTFGQLYAIFVSTSKTVYDKIRILYNKNVVDEITEIIIRLMIMSVAVQVGGRAIIDPRQFLLKSFVKQKNKSIELIYRFLRYDPEVLQVLIKKHSMAAVNTRNIEADERNMELEIQQEEDDILGFFECVDEHEREELWLDQKQGRK